MRATWWSFGVKQYEIGECFARHESRNTDERVYVAGSWAWFPADYLLSIPEVFARISLALPLFSMCWGSWDVWSSMSYPLTTPLPCDHNLWQRRLQAAYYGSSSCNRTKHLQWDLGMVQMLLSLSAVILLPRPLHLDSGVCVCVGGGSPDEILEFVIFSSYSTRAWKPRTPRAEATWHTSHVGRILHAHLFSFWGKKEHQRVGMAPGQFVVCVQYWDK